MSEFIPDISVEFRKHKGLADRAMADLSDDAFFRRPAEHVNPIALIVKHLAGNLASRWADFLTTDGEKPTRDRDSEFVLGPDDTRANLMVAWERGWSILFATLAALKDDDLEKSVTIRGEPHRVQQALLRGLNHAAYHVGQILYIARLQNPEARYLTVPPGQSRSVRGGYFSRPETGR
ncbi:MAG TPA: DUF1572 family protein [Gemmataceae bacterium]|nr:DUF1572 family protein [Gemmataceae bacterium]